MTIVLQGGQVSTTGYEQLVGAIKAYSENYADDFIDFIDLYIQQAEKRVYNDAKLPVSRKTAPVVFDTSGAVDLPADFIEVQEVYMPTGMLLQKDPSFLVEAHGADIGTPKYYAYTGATTLLIAPKPAIPVTGSVAYFGYPDSIVVAGNTWLYSNYDQVLLSACLFEAAMFMKAEADMVAIYKSQYETAIAPLKAITKGDKFRTG